MTKFVSYGLYDMIFDMNIYDYMKLLSLSLITKCTLHNTILHNKCHTI